MGRLLKTAVFLLCTAFIHGNVYYQPGKFPYSKCNQSSEGVSCQSLNIKKEIQGTPSLWPSGPYAVLMSKYRCPERYSQGWRKGVLKVGASSSEKDRVLNFCVKIRHDPKLDEGRWIPGSYTVFKKGDTCPKGFLKSKQTLKIEMFTQDFFLFGYVPNFSTINNAGNISIIFDMCEWNSLGVSSFGMLLTDFLLGKKADSECPQFSGGYTDTVAVFDETGNSYCSYTYMPNGEAKELISDVHMSTGIVQIDESEEPYGWYQFDLGRTLSVIEIAIKIQAQNESNLEEQSITCFYDDVMLSFLNFEAKECNERKLFSSDSLRLLPRNMHARFITLLFNDSGVLLQKMQMKESVKFFISGVPDNDQCNEDLGMLDGGIKDLQVTASSWLQENPPSSARPFSDGWCAKPTDSKPWIMVNLMAVTLVEAVRMWTEQADNLFFFLYYGKDVDTLKMYKDMHFSLENTRTVLGLRTFMLLNPIETRYVKLELQDTNTCLRFEIQGCKLSGILTLHCSEAYEMFETESSITNEREPVIQSDVDTHEACSSLCIQERNCSAAKYEGMCMHSMPSQFALWQISNQTNCRCMAKLCANDPVVLRPTVFHTQEEFSANVEKVVQDAVITSIGYPFSYETGQNYKWLITLSAQSYVKLIFTNISLSEKHEACYDRLRISKIVITETPDKEIDQRFNDKIIVIETGESLLVLTFFSCRAQKRITERGFRAVIKGEDIPACLSFDSDMVWSKERYDVCKEPEMFLTSMSILNFPFEDVDETWEIRSDGNIQLHILYFYVVCPSVSGEKHSKFQVADSYEERVFCNKDIKQDVIHGKSSYLAVKFRKHADPAKTFIRTEGFRIRYSTSLATHNFTSSIVCSETFKKCYRLLSALTHWTDAASHCLVLNQRLVSVQSQDELDFINDLLREMPYRETVSKQYGYSYDSRLLAHIGLSRKTDRRGKKALIWEDSSPLTYSAWREGNPLALQDCTRTYFGDFGNKTWESELCTIDVAQYYVCESSWKDGHHADEDNRTYNACPEGWMEYDGSCYYSSKSDNITLTWHKSAEACASLGSYLVEVEDAVEEDFLKSMFYDEMDHYAFIEVYWIGATDLINEGVFVWNYSGNALGYSNWGWNEPRHYGKDCLTYRLYGNWYARKCSNSEYFVCEKNADITVNICEESFLKADETIRITYAGNDCQDWSLVTGIAKLDFTERFPNHVLPTDALDYCKDPTSSGILWCYTKSSQIHLWEPCLIPPSGSEDAHAESIQHTNSNTFECKDGSTISSLNRCDGVFHCKDFSDETYCSIKGQYLTNFAENYLIASSFEGFVKAQYHLCGSKEWISVLNTCDDIIDCLDASDELDCSEHTKEFNVNGTCDDSSCSQTNSVCDFTPDYANAAAEFREILPCVIGEFMCNSGQCISISKRCNAIEDCTDESDETLCDSCIDSFHCDTYRCIPLGLTCDNYPDCEDGSDELSCFSKTFLSCDEWWDHGYKNSGEYIIGGVTVFCDFTSFTSVGMITMTIQNIDIGIHEKRGYFYTPNLSSLRQHNETDVRSILYRDGYECFIEIQTSCKFYTAVSGSKESYYDDFYQQCSCSVETFKTTKDRYWFWKKVLVTDERFERYTSFECNEAHGKSGPVNESVYYHILSDGYFYIDDRILKNQLSVEITPGPITCFYEHRSNTTKDEIACERNDKPIPSSLLCIYDVDAFSVLIGCRSGRHLENCGNFSCPENTVKCPGSYCIPLQFVCDQKFDCPEGHDEHQCTCENSKKEVLIIADDKSNQSESTIAAGKLAEQFYNKGSRIRLLLYRTATPLAEYNFEHRLLEIQEYIQSMNRISGCFFKSLAKNFLQSIRFDAEKSKSIVFIENSLEASKIAELMFSNLSKPNFMIYRVLKNVEFSLQYDEGDTYRFVKDVHIQKWNAFYSLGYKRFPEICKAVTDVPCSGGFRCSSGQCIPLKQVCDGISQCNGKDDERLCTFFCPYNCSCVGYSVDCRDVNLSFKDALSLSINTRSADLSRNPDIYDTLSNNNLNYPRMIRLNLSAGNIEYVNEKGFFYLKNLQCLDIGYNNIKMLPDNTFRHLKNLVSLNLDGNYKLRVISSTAFHGLISIQNIRITRSNLKRVLMHTFYGLHVQTIDISYNRIEEIEDFAFNNTSVEKINLKGNNILNFNKRIFNGVTSLKELLTPAFKFCCIRPCYVEENNCFPRKNEFSSCGDLMRHPILQAVLWLVGISALIGNFASITYRLVYDRARLKIGYGIFVTNLAIADFLMGVYLIMIAVADSTYRNRYIFMDEQWRNSAWCVMAGVLSTVSSEASVLFLCLITLDRLLVIKYPFGTIRFGPTKAYISCFVSWLIALVLALIPLFHKSYFQHTFYSRTGVCVALPLTRDKPPGWMYSVGIFVGLNFCTFILVAFGQMSIFLVIRKNSLEQTQKSRKRDLQVARNLILVASTDFMCWFPVGVMGIMALTGYPVPGDVYAWTAVFVLPLNSALNPTLYTLTAIIGKQSFNTSTDEQNTTKREIGSGILRYHDFIQSVCMEKTSDGQNGKKVNDLDNEEDSLSTLNVISIGLQLSNLLYHHHESSVSIDRISTYNTYVKLFKKKKSVRILVDSLVHVAIDKNDLQDNVYQFGRLMQRLLALVRRTHQRRNHIHKEFYLGKKSSDLDFLSYS